MDSLELQQRLDALSLWRKKELSLARDMAENEDNEERKRYLCRVWTLMLYAHCDNFLKQAAKYYIEYLETSRPKNYRTEVIWLMFKGKENATNAAHKKYLSLSSQGTNFQSHFTVIKSNAIFEDGSFSYKTLRFFCDWVLQIGFAHDTRKVFCERLVKKRHAIAHGEEEYINDIDDCVKWHEDTFKFMDDLKDSILLSASL